MHIFESQVKSDPYAENSLISDNGTCYVAIEWAVVGDHVFIADLWKMLQSFALSVFLGLKHQRLTLTMRWIRLRSIMHEFKRRWRHELLSQQNFVQNCSAAVNFVPPGKIQKRWLACGYGSFMKFSLSIGRVNARKLKGWDFDALKKLKLWGTMANMYCCLWRSSRILSFPRENSVNTHKVLQS